LQEVVDAAKTAALRSPAGRLDPPLRVVGDEIANIAPLPKLPEIASDARGYGLQLVLALQSLPQAERRWGTAGARALAENCPAQVLLGGIADPVTLTRFCDLLGQVETLTGSTSWDPATGRGTTGTHIVQRPVMAVDALRAIGTGQALLVHRNHAPVMLATTPWWDRPDGPALTAAAAATRAKRTGTG
jgi:type IV secretory pathway TraG/TraD family ATPase VirD4